MLTKDNQNDALVLQFGFLVKKNVKDIEIYIPQANNISLNEEDIILLKKNEANDWKLFIIPVNHRMTAINVRDLKQVNLILHELQKNNIFIKNLKIEKRVENSKFFNQLKYKFFKMKAWTI